MDEFRAPDPQDRPLKATRRGRPLSTRRRPSTGLVSHDSDLDRVSVGPFREECESAISEISNAVKALSASVGSDPLTPQEASRQLKLNKNLTWKVARVLLASDCFEAIPMLPGPEAVEIYIAAFTAAGAPNPKVEALRTSFRRFDAVVERHFGTRADLEIALDGLRVDGNLEQSRRLAFRGMAGLVGLQVATRFTTHIITPSREHANRADMAVIAGIEGLKRMRPLGALPVFRAARMRTSADPQNPAAIAEPLFPSLHGEAPEFLVRDFSSISNASLKTEAQDGGTTVSLTPGPLGKLGETSLVFAMRLQNSLNLVRHGDDNANEFVTAISLPSEFFFADLLVHRSVRHLESLHASVHGTLNRPLPSDPQLREIVRLPIDCSTSWRKPTTSISIDRSPRYAALIDACVNHMGASLEEFTLARVALEFPPMPSSLLMRWDLPNAAS
jgi:hypothetical protein